MKYRTNHDSTLFTTQWTRKPMNFFLLEPKFRLLSSAACLSGTTTLIMKLSPRAKALQTAVGDHPLVSQQLATELILPPDYPTQEWAGQAQVSQTLIGATLSLLTRINRLAQLSREGPPLVSLPLAMGLIPLPGFTNTLSSMGITQELWWGHPQFLRTPRQGL